MTGRYNAQWTPEEDKIILTHKVSEAVKLLGRTHHAIEGRKFRLSSGITAKVPLRRWKKEDYETLQALWETHLYSNGEIADKMGFSVSTIDNHCRKLGLSTRAYLSSQRAKKQAEAVRLWNSGLSIRAIVEQIGIDRSTFSAWIVELNLPERERTEKVKFDTKYSKLQLKVSRAFVQKS